jgi:NADH dehydrogenase FAD-containing subunit
VKKLILAGAGHAHLFTMMNIGSLVRGGSSVVVIGPGDYHYYSGMGPGLLSGIYRPAEARFHVRRMVEARGGRFIQAHVLKIDPANHRVILSDHTALDYDVLSCNLGSEVIPVAGYESDIIPVKPIENLYAAGRDLEKLSKKGALRVAVIGGGAAGVELAGNLSRISLKAAHKFHITQVSRDEILSRYPLKMRRLALASFARRGISVMERAAVKQIEGRTMIFENTTRLAFDMAFSATGIRPTQVFRDSGFPVEEEGGMPVNEYLQSIHYPRIFGGGDCVSFVPGHLDRVGVYAVRQGPVLYQNIAAALSCGKLRPFRPQKRYLSILNMGDDRGILSWHSLVASGRLAFVLKNYIDKRFMKRFQLSGEMDEDG